jgi:allantoinase
VIDAKDLWVFPGGVDSHSHLNDPGLTESEDYYTGTCSAAAGGITTVLDHPLTVPITADKASFLEKRAEAEKKAVVDYALWAAALPDNVNEILGLAELGVIAFKSFLCYSPEIPSVNLGQLWEIMIVLKTTGLVLGVHCENQQVIDAMEKRFQGRGSNEFTDYAKARGELSEVLAAAEAITIAEAVGSRLHIVHTSSPEVVDRAWEAASRGGLITVETCPHYLMLSMDALSKWGPFAKCAPPLRSEASVGKMWQRLIQGKINFIGSDHATYTFEEKLTPTSIWDVPSGITGIQTMFPLVFSEMKKRGISPSVIAAMTSTNAAKTFGIYPQKGLIAPGSDADLCFVDPDSHWKINEKDLFYKMKWSPYTGTDLSGRIIHTMVRGRIVYSEGKIMAEPGTGKFLRPN